jgi:hypothetical protein
MSSDMHSHSHSHHHQQQQQEQTQMEGGGGGGGVQKKKSHIFTMFEASMKQTIFNKGNSVFMISDLIDKIYKENNTVNITNIEDQYILIKTPEASFNGNKFYATLGGGSVVEFIKVKDHYYVSTGTNWNGLTLTINI